MTTTKTLKWTNSTWFANNACRHSTKNKEWSTTTLKRELLLMRKIVILGKKEFCGFLGKRSYLRKYAINLIGTKSILLIKEYS